MVWLEVEVHVVSHRGKECIDKTEPQVTEGNNIEKLYFRNVHVEEIGRMRE